MLLIQLPQDIARSILQYVCLSDIARLQIACGKEFSNQFQEVVEGMIYTIRVNVSTDMSYLDHVRWMRRNKVYISNLMTSVNETIPDWEAFYLFLKDLLVFSGHHVSKLDMLCNSSNSSDVVKTVIELMPNITQLSVYGMASNELDVFELFGHLSLTSLSLGIGRSYPAIRVLSTWPFLSEISVPLLHGDCSEMSSSLGKNIKEMEMTALSDDSPSLMRYYPSLEKLHRSETATEVTNDQLHCIVNNCPNLKVLEVLLRPSKFHYLSQLAHCEQLEELYTGYDTDSPPRYLKRGISDRNYQITPLPQLKSLSCIFDHYLLSACPNLTKLEISNGISYSNNFLDSLIQLKQLRELDIRISADYSGIWWAVSMKTLLTMLSLLEEFECTVEGKLGRESDILYDVIGFGHQRLRELYIGQEDDGGYYYDDDDDNDDNGSDISDEEGEEGQATLEEYFADKAVESDSDDSSYEGSHDTATVSNDDDDDISEASNATSNDGMEVDDITAEENDNDGGDDDDESVSTASSAKLEEGRNVHTDDHKSSEEESSSGSSSDDNVEMNNCDGEAAVVASQQESSEGGNSEEDSSDDWTDIVEEEEEDDNKAATPFHAKLLEEGLLETRNIGNTAGNYCSCPRLTSITCMLPLCDSAYQIFTRCPNLQQLSLSADKYDFGKLLVSCPAVKSMEVASFNCWDIFHYSHQSIEVLTLRMAGKGKKKKISGRQSAAANRQSSMGGFPALKRLSIKGPVTMEEWRLLARNCKDSRIYKLELYGEEKALFTEELIDLIAEEEIFSELKYVVWERMYGNHSIPTEFMAALAVRGKGRFAVV